MTSYQNYIDKVNSVLNSSYLSPDQDKLLEEGIMSVGIVSFGRAKYVLYKFADGGDKIFPYFNPGLGLRKMCDYTLFLEKKNVLYIFAIELKNGSSTSKEQLDRSKLFLKFIVDSVNCIECNLDKIDSSRIFSIRISQSAIDNIGRRYREAKRTFKKTVRVQPLECIDGHINYTFKSLHLEKILELVV